MDYAKKLESGKHYLIWIPPRFFIGKYSHISEVINNGYTFELIYGYADNITVLKEDVIKRLFGLELIFFLLLGVYWQLRRIDTFLKE